MNAPEPLPDDELVSAVLDDEADEAVRSLVAADPVLSERLTVFNAIRDEVRDVTIPTELLDALRLTVLDTTVLDPTAIGAAGPVAAPVFALSARRARRTKAAGWISAAAAAVVLIAAIGLAGRDGDDTSSGDASMTAAFATGSSGSTGSRESTTDAATEDGSAGSSPGSGAATGGDASKNTGTSSTAAPSALPSGLGTFADLEALTAAYRSRVASGPAPTTTISTTTPPGTSSSTDPAATGPTAGATCGRVLALAVLGTRSVELVADGVRVLVVDRASCVTVGTFTP